eukprot:scaffold7154_cov75-Skeletonema_dohrnii-CCMP3373.AAC.1
MNGGVEKKEEEGSVEGEKKKKQDVESETVVNSGPKRRSDASERAHKKAQENKHCILLLLALVDVR